jgi:hypothetical protein
MQGGNKTYNSYVGLRVARNYRGGHYYAASWIMWGMLQRHYIHCWDLCDRNDLAMLLGHTAFMSKSFGSNMVSHSGSCVGQTRTPAREKGKKVLNLEVAAYRDKLSSTCSST